MSMAPNVGWLSVSGGSLLRHVTVIASLAAAGIALRHFEQYQTTRNLLAKRRYLATKLALEFLDTYEAAMERDAQLSYSFHNLGIAADEKSFVEFSENVKPSRAVLSHLVIDRVASLLNLMAECDVDPELISRCTFVLVHCMNLNVSMIPAEAARFAKKSQFVGHVPYAVIFSSSSRLAWSEFIINGRCTPVSDVIQNHTECIPVHTIIRDTFVSSTLRSIRDSCQSSRSASFRLLKRKVIDGCVGPLSRAPERHNKLVRNVLFLIAGEAILELTNFSKQFLTKVVSYGTFETLKRRLMGTTSFVPQATAGPSIQLIMISLSLEVLRTFIQPLVEEFHNEARDTLSTELVYEGGVQICLIEEALRSQPDAHMLKTSHMRSIAYGVSDGMLRFRIRTFGKIVGGITGLLIATVFLRPNALSLGFIAFVTGFTILRDGGSLTAKYFGLSKIETDHDFYSEHTVEEFDSTPAPFEESHHGLRTLLSVLSTEAASRHPHVGLLCGSGVLQFRTDDGAVGLLNSEPAELDRIEKYLAGIVKHFQRRREFRWALDQLVYSKDVVLRSAKEALRILSAQVDKSAEIASCLDPEEPKLLRNGAAYLRSFPDISRFFSNRQQFLTFRTLGLEVVQAYHSVSASRSKQHSRLIKSILSQFKDIQILESVIDELETAGVDFLQQMALSVVLLSLGPETRPALEEYARLWFTQIFTLSHYTAGSLMSHLQALTLTDRSAVQFEDILNADRLIASAIYGETDIDAARNAQRQKRRCLSEILQQERPELQFNDEFFVVGGFELRNAVQFHDVDFEYPNSGGHRALSSVTFSAKAKEFTALMGKTGSGKSTIVKILRLVYAPSPKGSDGDADNELNQLHGMVSLDSIPLAMFYPPYLRQLIAFVPQTPTVVADFSFAQNIAMLRDISFTDVVNAAKASRCHQFITENELGYHHLAGRNLSGGERQRIEIARALAGRPQILVLDEATSKLDAKSESQIQRTIENLSGVTTVIAIAHRLSTLKRANHYVVLHEGAVIQEGSHDALMESDGPHCPPGHSYREQLALQRLSDVGTASNASVAVDLPVPSTVPLVAEAAPADENFMQDVATVKALLAATATSDMTDEQRRALLEKMVLSLRSNRSVPS